MRRLKKPILIWCGGSITTMLALLLTAANMISNRVMIVIGAIMFLLFFLCIYDSLYRLLDSKNSWGSRNAFLIFFIAFAATVVFGILRLGNASVVVAAFSGMICVTVIIYHGLRYILSDIIIAIEKFKDLFLG